MYKYLFTPKKIGKMVVPNRVVMTAMGNYLANTDGSVSEEDIAFYGARAKGGVGLIITECTCVNFETGKGNTHQIAVDDDKYIPGLKRLADEVHKYGSVIAVQIYHPGRQGIAALNGNKTMAAPSPKECLAVRQPTHEMTKEEIKETIDRFVQAARRLKEAGIDAVEIHAAHGYLINQFLSPYTNLRTDEYGGSFENRMRFLDEIILGIRQACGPDYPIIVRFSATEYMDYAGKSGEGLQLEDGIKIAKHLEKLGVDALDVSSGIYETMNTAWEPVGFDQGWKIENAARIKKEVNIPVIGVSVIRDPEYAEYILAEGKVDFVGSARQFFADPAWANKAKNRQEKSIRKCISCLHCMETLMNADLSTEPVACAINYEGGRELHYGEDLLKEDGDNRVVVIIGAGPAGMEAARILAKRKFKPIIFEKKSVVGGQILYGSRPPKKEKIAWLIDYLKNQLEELGVEIRLNHAPNIEEIKELNPYAVFVAHGSKPMVPKSIPGIDGEKVFTAIDILNEDVKLMGKKVAVIGSGMTGIETADLLGAQGNDVTVFEMEDEIGPGVFFQNLIDVMKRIQKHDVKLYPKHKLVAIEGTTVVAEKTDTKETKKFDGFDAVVLALGTVSNTAMVDDLKKEFDKVIVLGDTKKAGKIVNAIGTGYKEAFEL